MLLATTIIVIHNENKTCDSLK